MEMEDQNNGTSGDGRPIIGGMEMDEPKRCQKMFLAPFPTYKFENPIPATDWLISMLTRYLVSFNFI